MYIFFPRGKRCFCFYIYVCVFNESKTKVFFLSHGIFRGIRFPLNTAIQLRFHLCMFCLLISIHSGGDLWACLVVVVVFFGFFFFFADITSFSWTDFISPILHPIYSSFSYTANIWVSAWNCEPSSQKPTPEWDYIKGVEDWKHISLVRISHSKSNQFRSLKKWEAKIK